MPDAQPFTFIGSITKNAQDEVTGGVLLEGFPFCPGRVDVDDYDYWTTLSGFKKTDGGTPTQAQIDLSLANAMQLYWNLFSFNGLAENSFDSLTYVEVGQSPQGTGEIVPDRRVCNTSIAGKNSSGGLDITIPGVAIQRLFNSGDFIGYGVNGILVRASASGSSLVFLYSYLGSAAIGPNLADTDYATLDSTDGSFTFHFVGVALGVTTVDASNLVATTSVNSLSTSSRFDSIELYTYP